MVRAIVTGAAGKMGMRIATLIAATEGIEVAGAVERADHPAIGRDHGELLGQGKSGVTIVGRLQDCIDNADVVIDFTSHEASMENLNVVVAAKKAIVIGSTGFTAEEIAKVQTMSGSVRCVLAPNMSVGVNVLLKALDYVAKILGDDYDVEIVEAHHNQKKDAPSGTAMKIAEVLAAALNRDLNEVGVYERRGMIGARTKKEIGIQTLRAGDIVGEHTVMFAGNGERLELIHRAHSRDNFAKGSIRAAQWLVDRPNGLYDMQDVLGLKNS